MQLDANAQDLPQPFVCTFCKKPKTFDHSRRDNFKAHIKLHQTNKAGNRTTYHPGAGEVLAQLESENKGTRSIKPKPKKTSDRKIAKTEKMEFVKTEVVS